MAKTLSGWKRIHTSTQKGKLAHYRETIYYGSGNVVDCICSEFGELITTQGVPKPPAGVDFTVVFVQNNTMSAAGDIVLEGAEASGGTFGILKDNLVAFAAVANANGFATAAQYVQQSSITPTGGRMPVMRFFEDDDGLHSTSIGVEQTSEIHLYYVIP